MIDIIVDTIIDVLKLIPFLFVAFLLIEVLEHKLNLYYRLKKILEDENLIEVVDD